MRCPSRHAPAGNRDSRCDRRPRDRRTRQLGIQGDEKDAAVARFGIEARGIGNARRPGLDLGLAIVAAGGPAHGVVEQLRQRGRIAGQIGANAKRRRLAHGARCRISSACSARRGVPLMAGRSVEARRRSARGGRRPGRCSRGGRCRRRRKSSSCRCGRGRCGGSRYRGIRTRWEYRWSAKSTPTRLPQLCASECQRKQL